MLYGADIAVCSQINTEQINTVWAEYQFVSYELVGTHDLYDLKCQPSHPRPRAVAAGIWVENLRTMTLAYVS